MKLSARIQSLTSSPIRKLSPYADAAKAKGKKIYHLNIGQPDIKTPDQFMESIRTYDEQVIAYGNSKGDANTMPKKVWILLPMIFLLPTAAAKL